MKTGFHIDAAYLRHETPEGHPERAARLECLLPLAGRSRDLGVTVIAARRRATTEELSLVHEPSYVEAIASRTGRTTMLDPDTYMSPRSYETACLAAGAGLDLVDRVMAEKLDNAFAAVRPPGHHAEARHAMGFCLFNNIAIAAAYALKHYLLERVMILDWDVHHGNGTQSAFWNDPRVLFVSLHQYPFYPGTGAADETGGSGAPGMTVNIPMSVGCGDAEYAAAFRHIVRPVAEAFAPELVLVSAGFDAHAADPIGGMDVSVTGFEAMCCDALDIARQSARGRVIAILEGGYDLDALRSCVETVLARMASPERPRGRAPAGEGRFGLVLASVRSAHEGRWSI